MQNKPKLNTILLVIIIILLVVVLVFLSKNNSKQKAGSALPSENQNTVVNTPIQNSKNLGNDIVGSDRDAHGCIGSAGYTWCAVKNKCLRGWEEKCESVAPSSCTSTTGPWVKVLSPNGGETFTAGEQMTVKWESCNIPASSQDLYVSLLFNGSYANAPAKVLSNTVQNDGTETFTIPVGLAGSYKVLIGNSSARVKSDMSDNLFFINPAHVI